jgi:hypothetical protein
MVQHDQQDLQEQAVSTGGERMGTLVPVLGMTRTAQHADAHKAVALVEQLTRRRGHIGIVRRVVHRRSMHRVHRSKVVRIGRAHGFALRL